MKSAFACKRVIAIVFSCLLPALVFVSAQSSGAVAGSALDFWADAEPAGLAQNITHAMTDEELLSQILMFGWAGAAPDALLERWVSERSLGCVKVFGWNTLNVQQVAASVGFLQRKAAANRFHIPLFVATDQEGGWIRHVKGDTSQTPGNIAIGASGYPLDAYWSAYYINREINALGINMNFAPVVDLYTNLESTIIGPRSFGADPVKCALLAEAFSKGMSDAGVLATAKHFPGHGDTSLDSHGMLPTITVDTDTWKQRELVPFKHLIDCGVPAVMSGHLAFPQVTGDDPPASLSHIFLTDILRTQLGFTGLIITDDMMMNGATEYAGALSRAVMLAIEAGNDIVISSSTPGMNDPLWTVSLERMAKDSAFRSRVRDAACRVVLAKLRYFKQENAAPLFPDEATVSKRVPDRDGQRFFLEQACRSITVLRSGTAFPFHPAKGERVLIAGPFQSLYAEGQKRYPAASTFYMSYELKSDRSNYDLWNASNLTGVASTFDTIIMPVYDEHSAKVCQRLRNLGKRVIVFSVMSPVYVLNGFDWADTILCAYSYSDFSCAALFAALNGEIPAEGVLPL